MHDLKERLKAQNNGKGWLDCEAHGRRHRFGTGQRVGTPPVLYIPCRRCPVTIRKAVR